MEIITSDAGERFARLPDDPMRLVPIDEDEYRAFVADGMHESNALDLAVQAPYRVIWGMGVFENCATLDAAVARCNEVTVNYTDSVGTPHVVRMESGKIVHRPGKGLFA